MESSKQKWLLGLAIMMMFALCLSAQGYEYKKASFTKKIAADYKKAERQFKKGQIQFKKKQLDRAQEYMQKALKIFPHHADAMYHLALLSYLKKDNVGALRHIVAAKEAVVWLNDLKAKVTHERKRKLDEYQRDLKNGTYVGQLGGSAGSMMGAGYSKLLIHEVEWTKEKVTDKRMLGIPADFFYVHGNILFRMESYKKAIIQYVETVKRNPRHGLAFNNLAILFLKAKDKEKARVCVRCAGEAGFKVNPRLKKELESL